MTTPRRKNAPTNGVGPKGTPPERLRYSGIKPHRLFETRTRLYARFEIRRRFALRDSRCLPPANRSLGKGPAYRPRRYGCAGYTDLFLRLFLDYHLLQTGLPARRRQGEFTLPARLPQVQRHGSRDGGQ